MISAMKPSVDILNCPLCESPYKQHFADFQNKGTCISYWLCSSCGLVYQSPRMSEHEQSEFYSEHYRTHLFDQAEPPSFDIRIQNERARHLSAIIKNNCGELAGKLHLDIGCGIGALINRIMNDHATKGTGVEPDRAYLQYAKDHKLNVYPSLSEWSAQLGKKAFLVTMSHVLEHLQDPLTFLEELREEHISPDGYILVEVPNLYFHQAFELAHNYAFSRKTLTEILKKAGYSILFFKEHGIPLNLTPRYLTVIAQPLADRSANAAMSGSPSSRLLRRLGMSLSRTEDWVRRMLRRIKNRLKHL